MILDALYTLISKDENQALIQLSNSDHPVFKAHFPTEPILPGFAHFEIVAEIFNLEITSIKRAKYTAAVIPEQILRYEKTDNKFKVFCGDKVVASFSL